MNQGSSINVKRKPPSDPNGIRQVQVGCGPHNVLSDWWNVDIRYFKGVDEVMDVTKPWAWDSLLQFVYGEHFIEHIDLGGAINFLQYALKALKPGGRIRLSTPSLEWVLLTHFDIDANDEEKNIRQTFGVNRAFHGWGHQFLYSRPLLERIIGSAGFTNIEFFSYSESNEAKLENMERHGGFSVVNDFPSVWIVEAKRPEIDIPVDDAFLSRCQDDYIKYVAAGH